MASNESRIVGFGHQIVNNTTDMDDASNMEPMNATVRGPARNVELEDEIENLIINFSRLQISETYEAENEE